MSCLSAKDLIAKSNSKSVAPLHNYFGNMDVMVIFVSVVRLAIDRVRVRLPTGTNICYIFYCMNEYLYTTDGI